MNCYNTVFTTVYFVLLTCLKYRLRPQQTPQKDNTSLRGVFGLTWLIINVYLFVFGVEVWWSVSMLHVVK